MCRLRNKQIIVALGLMAITVTSTSFVTTVDARGYKKSYDNYNQNGRKHSNSGQRAVHSNTFDWGHPCNDYGPVGSFNNHRGKKGPVNQSACAKVLENGETINPFR